MRAWFLLFVAVVVTVASPAGAQDGLEMLPSDAAGVLTVPSLARFYDVFEMDALRAQYPRQFAFLSDEMVEDVGVDLLNPRALASEGFDLGRPLHIGFLVEPSAVVVLIPGEDRALSWVRGKIEDQGVEFTQENDHEGTTIESDDADDIACFAHQGYVAVVVTDRGKDGAPALETARRLIDARGGANFSRSERYKQVMSKLPSGTDLQFYVDGRLQQRVSGWGRSEKELEEAGVSSDEMKRTMEILGVDKSAAGIALQFQSDRLNVYSYNWLGKKAPILSWFRVGRDPVPFMRRVPGDPWFLMLARVNGAAMWKTVGEIRSTLPDSLQHRDAFVEANRELGIDVEKDIIEQVDGNAGLSIDRISLMGQEGMFIVQVADPVRFRATLATVTARAREKMAARAAQSPNQTGGGIVEEKAGDGVFYRFQTGMVEMCYGVVDDHLVVTTSAQRYRDIVAGTPGLSDAVKNADVRGGLFSHKSSVLYVDFQGLARDAQGFLPMMGPGGERFSRILSELSELASTGEVDAEGSSQTLTLTSTSPGVWKRLLAMALENLDVE